MRVNRKLARATQRHAKRLAILTNGLAMMLILTAYPVRAHGGGALQLTNAEAGPYRVSAWTQPDPPRAGQMHLTIAVSEAPPPGARAGETGKPVLDARVKVQIEPVKPSGETLVAFATRENAVNKLLYEVDINLPAEGQWKVTIELQGPAGDGRATFEIEILPPSRLDGLGALYWPVLGGVGMALLAAIWWMWPSRGQYHRDPRHTGGSQDRRAKGSSRHSSSVGDPG